MFELYSEAALRAFERFCKAREIAFTHERLHTQPHNEPDLLMIRVRNRVAFVDPADEIRHGRVVGLMLARVDMVQDDLNWLQYEDDSDLLQKNVIRRLEQTYPELAGLMFVLPFSSPQYPTLS
jgi:hypothetical protein